MDSHQLTFVFLILFLGKATGGGTLSSCPEDYFSCDDDERCIPSDMVCDGKPHCVDATDEMECDVSRSSQKSLPNENDPQAVERAVDYLLSQGDPNLNWADFTPRALVALSFTRKFARIPARQKQSILNAHKMQLLLSLQEGVETIPLHTLALHANALYAMCSDPRDFEGINLIDLLRFRTDKAIGSTKFNKPNVILTLCLAKSSRLEDFELLIKMFDQKMQTTATKALILIAMAACNRQVQTYEYKVRTEEFINRLKMNTGKIGAYTLGLIIQAVNAWEYTSPLRNELLIQQSESGAFQDLLGTYSAIPALLNTSLADLKCSRTYQENPAQPTSLQVFSPERNIDLSLSIPSGDNIGRHTLRVTFSGRKSLFELMEIAASQNKMFRFTYELDGYEKKVTSLAGISNDAESGLSWILYRTAAGHKPSEERVESGDIERIFPEDGDHFVFQLE